MIFAFGGFALAPIAVGGFALGYYAAGGAVFGAHAVGGSARDPVAKEFFRNWPIGGLLFANMIVGLLGISIGSSFQR